VGAENSGKPEIKRIKRLLKKNMEKPVEELKQKMQVKKEKRWESSTKCAGLSR